MRHHQPVARRAVMAGVAASLACSHRPIAATPPQPPSGLPRGLFLDIRWTGSVWLAVGEAGRIARSDTGETWQLLQTPTTATLTSLLVGRGQEVWCVGHLGTILASSDGGQRWRLEHQDREMILLSITLTEAGPLAVGAYGSALQHTGTRWQRVAIDDEDLHWNAALSINGQTWLAGEGGRIVRGQPGNWQLLTEGGGSFFTLAPTATGVIAGGLGGRLIAVDADGRVTPIPAGSLTWQGANVDSNGRVVLVGLGGAVATLAAGHLRLANRADRMALAGLASGPRGVFAVGEAGIVPLRLP